MAAWSSRRADAAKMVLNRSDVLNCRKSVASRLGWPGRKSWDDICNIRAASAFANA
jgi:hypothetical protein